ncbi:MAG: Ferredoxin, 2Fe-2S, partial [uncultured Acetobacteraceae bacterium]
AQDVLRRARRRAPRGGRAARPFGAGDRAQARRRYRGRLRGLARLLNLPRHRGSRLDRQARQADGGRGGHARPRLRPAGDEPAGLPDHHDRCAGRLGGEAAGRHAERPGV